MDISTIIGLVAGLGAIVVSIMLSNGRFALFLDAPSAFIVFGGLIAGLLVAYPIPKMLGSLKSIKIAFANKGSNPVDVIKQINDLASAARKDGLLALEEIAQNMDDPFLKKGIMLVVDGTDPELVRNIMETELVFIETRHKENHAFWETISDQGPAWGMVGTLLGLIIMLDELDDPSTLGPKMAVALVTTFYGSVIANLLANPIASKLKGKTKDEILLKQLAIEGLLSIQAGENPRVIEEKLKAFLSPTVREAFNEGADNE